LQFNYLTAPANNLNVNLVHHQQKPFVSHPYSEHYYYESSNNNNRSYNGSTPNSTIRSVKNYRKPHPPVGSALQLPSGASYNVVMNTSNTPSANNASYQTTSPMTNNLNNSYNNTSQHSYKLSNNVSQSNNLNHSNISKADPHNASTLSRRSSQSSSSHEWMSEKPHSLSLCINRINPKKSNKNSSSSASSGGGGGDAGKGGAQFQSMRCRKHRNRNHFFNTSTSTSYQKYKLTKSCSNDTVNSDQPTEIERNPQTTYKFI
jgi:uncharacterized membrane protein YgcG